MMIELTEEQIDDILFYARTGQLEELQTCIKELPQAKSTSEGDIVIAAVEDQSQNTSLHMAAANGQLGALNYILKILGAQAKASILDAQNAWGNTPLHWAALNGHLEVVKALLAAGATMGIKNKAGHDAFYDAEMNSKNSVVEWILQQDKGLESRSEEAQELASVDDEQESDVQNEESEFVVKGKDISLNPLHDKGAG